MDALVVAKAKVNFALVGTGFFPQAQEGGGEKIDDLLMRMARIVRGGDRFVIRHGLRSIGERSSC